MGHLDTRRYFEYIWWKEPAEDGITSHYDEVLA